MKEYNHKLCKKGLLERGLKVNLYIGEFKALENEFLKNSIMSNANSQDLKENMKNEKEKSVQNEIKKLTAALTALERTICSIKKDVKSRVSDETYGIWLNRMNSVSMRFKSMFSDINNDMYNHWYRMSKKIANVWDNIAYDVKWTKDNVCDVNTNIGSTSNVSKNVGNVSKDVLGNVLHVDGFEEGDLSSMFKETSDSTLLGKRKSCNGNENVKKFKLNENENHKDDPLKGLENISGGELSAEEEDESAIIDGIFVVDEVGEVNLSNFEDMINRIME